MKRRLTIAVVLALTVAIAAQAPNAKSDKAKKDTRERRIVITCDEDSFLSGDVTYDALVKRLGTANVLQQAIAMGEGTTEPGVVLFANRPERRLEIVWRENPRQVLVLIRGQSKWMSAGDMTIGTTLKQLERLNRGTFTLAGFDWDYGGTVLSWRGGRLDTRSERCKVQPRLDYERGENGAVAELVEQVRGDQDFSSGHPAMRKLNPRIYEIVVSWQLSSASN